MALGSSGILSGKPKGNVIAREVSYTVYGENLEATLKLLTLQKSISLMDKKDPKYKRMFITATHYKTVQPSRVESLNECTETPLNVKAVEPSPPPQKKVFHALASAPSISPKILFPVHLLDNTTRGSILARMRKCLESLEFLSHRYCTLDEMRQFLAALEASERQAAAIAGKTPKKRKLYTLRNPMNLYMVEVKAELEACGYRQLTSEYDLA